MSLPDRVPRKILCLFTNLLGIGGVQEAGRLTAAAVGGNDRSRGGTVEILGLNDPPGEHTLLYGDSRITFMGFGRAKTRFVLSAIGSALRTPSKGASIILAAHPHLALPASCIQHLCPRFKTVVMAHGIEVWTMLPPLRLRALRNASAMLAPSSYTAKKIADAQGIANSKIRRLPWPLSPSFLNLSCNPGKLVRPRSFPSGQVILTVGRWDAEERYKGADSLIRAVARLRATIPDAHLVAVGTGSDLPRLRTIAGEEQVADRIHFLEDLSVQELAACYANADIFALPSTGEGFGLVFLEAMAFAKPVVGADAGGINDLVRDGINGLLVPPNDTDRLAQSLLWLLQDASLRAKLGECGAAIVRREYQFDVFRDKLDQILCDVASDRL